MTRAFLAFLLSGVLGVAWAKEPPAAPSSTDDMFRVGRGHLDAIGGVDGQGHSLERLRTLWFLSVAEDSMLPRARAEWGALRERGDLHPDLQAAYDGALEVVAAKHALWPPRKLDHLKAAAPLLDSAVARSPNHPEIRYLRLMSCYYLPFFFGRKASVEEDFHALARLLPGWTGNVGEGLRGEVARFVLEKSDNLSPQEKARLAPLARIPSGVRDGASRR